MLRYVVAFILLVHGSIHLMGFAKAFGYGNISQLTKDISKPLGAIWLFACLLFVLCTAGYLLNKQWWPVVAIFAIVVSQVVIITSWKDARFGTIANCILLLVAIAGWGSLHFEAAFKKEVTDNIKLSNNLPADIVTEMDMSHLPQPVQKYLRYSGSVGQPKIKNVKIVFTGQMREKGKDWFSFESVQYNFFVDPTRLFFMKGKMFGLLVPGYHRYTHGNASMDIRLFGWVPIVQQKGDLMDKTETVTVFNDMCLMAPATLIDKRVQWEPVDSLSVKAIFTNGSCKIMATLFFNEKGQLINFTSNDRMAISDGKQYPFSTPVKEYTSSKGRNVLSYGEAIWHYPEGEFVYGKFTLKSIEYNVTEMK